MTDSDMVLVFNPSTQGGRAVSHLRGGMLKVRWDQPVRAVPRASAEDLIRMGGMLPALDVGVAAKQYGLPREEIRRLGKAGELHLAIHRTAEGREVDVLVLDAATRQRLRQAAAAAAPTTEQPNP